MKSIQGNKSQYGYKNTMGNTSSIRATITTNVAYNSPKLYTRSPVTQPLPHSPQCPPALSTKILPKWSPQPALKSPEQKQTRTQKIPTKKTQQQFKQMLYRENKAHKHAHDLNITKKKRQTNQIKQPVSELRSTLDVVNFGVKSEANSFKRQTIHSPKPDVGFWKSKKNSPSKLAFNVSGSKAGNKSFLSRNKGISRFRLFKLIGQGTFTDVYLGIEKKTFTLWSIKRIKKTLINTPELKAQISKILALHLRISHPNIVRIFDVFADESYVYVVEEFMESGTLEQLIAKNKAALKENQIGEKIGEVVGATKYVHEMNYVHGGLKPSSILVCLGTCKLPSIQNLDSGALNLAAIYKSLNYTPPEALSNQTITNAYDMWCIGLILYELVMSRPLFSFICQKTLMRNILNFSLDDFGLPEYVSYQIQALLRSLLQPNPKNRMTAQEMVQHNFIMEFRGDAEWGGSLVSTEEKSGVSSATFDQ